jgi:antibiotic biosynthesis monooxygenase (ABM) superfamily enzyme
MRVGYLIIALAFPVAGYIVSYNNNLANQPVILQLQTWVAIGTFVVMVLAGWLMLPHRKKG